MRGIPLGELAFTMPMVASEIQRALDHTRGEVDLDDIKLQCKHGTMQLWVVMEEGVGLAGVVTTEIVDYPNLKACRVVALAGENLDKWVRLVDEVLAAWARQLKCDVLEAVGRAGWTRKLAKVGWKQQYVFVGRELS